MHRRLIRTIGGTLAAGCLWLAEPIAAQQSGSAPAPSFAELEAAGATIRTINVDVANVFDPSNPKENKRLYRAANHLHMLTRRRTIASVLLFHEGDAFSTQRVEESERALRAFDFLSGVTIEPRGYDEPTNSVEIEIHTQDSWSLSTDMKFRHSGGASEWGAGLEDRNLFGRGKSLKVSHRSFIDRDETYLGYIDPNVLGSRVRLTGVYADASDGYRRQFGVERPFFALDTRWSAGGSILDEERVDQIYDLGDEIDSFRHDLRAATVQGGWSSGLNDGRANRWLVGLTTEEDRFAPALDSPQPLLLPGDRKLVYPWVGWQTVEDDYREMTQLNDLGRTEDISLGLNLSITLGLARQSFGSDRDATLLRVAAEKGWEPGGAGKLLLFSAGGSARNEADGLQNAQMYVGARYYRRNLEKHLLAVSMSALTSSNLDFDQQVLLGGDNGLRGYPLRYQAGKHRAIVSVEQRFFTDWYPWRLARVGYALFADAGQVSGRDPRGTASRGTLYDVGVGLRLSSPRASGRSVVHIDLAFPLNRDPTIDNVQLIIESKGSF